MGFQPFSILTKLHKDLAPKCLKPSKVLEKVKLASHPFFSNSGRAVKGHSKSKAMQVFSLATAVVMVPDDVTLDKWQNV